MLSPKDFTVISEQIQSGKSKPDFRVEMLDEKNDLSPYLLTIRQAKKV